MRRFLLFVGSMVVGATTIVSVLMLATDPGGMIAVVMVQWPLALAFGMVASAPFFLAPPDTIGVYTVTLPIPFALALLGIRAVAWVGRMVLTGAWSLAFLVRRPAAGPPSPATPSAGPVGVGPLAATGPAPSWQPDPTGRFLQRFWDGTQWTAHVANGPHTAIDPF